VNKDDYYFAPYKRDVHIIIQQRGRVDDTEYLACAEPLRRAGLSAAAETLVLILLWLQTTVKIIKPNF